MLRISINYDTAFSVLKKRNKSSRMFYIFFVFMAMGNIFLWKIHNDNLNKLNYFL